jgi:hypothetical protein
LEVESKDSSAHGIERRIQQATFQTSDIGRGEAFGTKAWRASEGEVEKRTGEGA